jgi:hypothetical protein
MTVRQAAGGSPESGWLLEPHWLRSIGPAYDPESEPELDACVVVLLEAFDVLIYFDQTMPSILLR